MKRLPFAALATLALAGCSGINDPEYERRLALIAPVKVEVPATADRGVAFDVAVTSYGGGCVDPAGTEVKVSALVAVVEPYQSVPVGDGHACTKDLREARQVARVRFDQAGTGIIRFRGIGGTGSDTIMVERTIVVE